MFALQSLHPSQLIGAQHPLPFLGQGGSISVQSTDVTNFGVKLLVLWRCQPIAYQMGF